MAINIFKSIGCTLCLAIATISQAQSWPSSFSQAKKRAENEVYYDRNTTFYCQCDFVFDDTADKDNDGNIKETMVYPQGCGYEPRKATTRTGKANARASRIEWEHIMPASYFGSKLDEWQNPENYPKCVKSNGKAIAGRKCAEKLVPWFEKAHNDLHNLTPAVGELNGDRSNFAYAEIAGERRSYGQCDFEVNFAAKVAEPPDNVKGNIARVYLYMVEEHKIELDEETRILMQNWHKLDPVDSWECERDKRIEATQGNNNKFVHSVCD